MPERRSLLRQSIASGLDYVLGLQAGDGCWTDWELPPGSSSTWTTAYVGYQLRSLPADDRVRAADPIRLAARWLLGKQFAEGGWGYNEAVEADADSTAFAILLAASAGETPLEEAFARLVAFQCPDGGFSTYRFQGSRNSWVASHADVTPIVLFAFLTKYPRGSSVMSRGLDYVLQNRTSAGLWNSFWWDSCLYSTEANLSLLRALGVPIDTGETQKSLLREKPRSAYEIALLVSSLISLDSDASAWESVEQLTAQQQSDGSWKSEPSLRVTRRDCYEPWRCANPGALFADPKRLFTSATVIAALSKVYARM
jgi:squalene cyclase